MPPALIRPSSEGLPGAARGPIPAKSLGRKRSCAERAAWHIRCSASLCRGQRSHGKKSRFQEWICKGSAANSYA